jgi:hypothetical protein
VLGAVKAKGADRPRNIFKHAVSTRGPAPDGRKQVVGSDRLGDSCAGLPGIAHRALQHAGREALRQHRPENGRGQH